MERKKTGQKTIPIPMVLEIHTKQSINEENSSFFMNSILLKGKHEGRNLNSEKFQDYARKPQ